MITTLDELTTFLKICRKQGISEIKFADIFVKFGDTPDKSKKSEATEEVPVVDEFVAEELAFYGLDTQ